MSSSTVAAWEQEVVFPTYPALAADPNPMFLETRVYQGSSGKVYPNPFTDRVAKEKQDQTYKAVMLENEFVQLMILPEIGGRIHVGFDKTNGYDFFYRQNVIKPALVGLLGPWISGGVEFNWPQHHRPSTYMPVHHHIEHEPDGSVIVWLSEHEPMNRLKGMVGICLRPGRSIIEARVRIYNRTPLPQTFLWWANVAALVHDDYQSFFPPDVTFVADHAKRAVSSFPEARNFYYGVDYRDGVDLSWYKNIPVPTSYMVTQSKYDFFGGYDYRKRAGFVHVANRHVVPGKKQWTWGNGDFGYAWDRNLTDADGPYIELMAGAYTDNQPDFAWLQPYETKTFSQFWYPIQEIGPAQNANEDAALSLRLAEGEIKLGICTSGTEEARVRLSREGATLYEASMIIAPGRPHLASVPATSPTLDGLRLEAFAENGSLLIGWSPEPPADAELPEAATEPAEPETIASIDELFLIGLHLEQYRHATRDPELYWKEGLRRDPNDSRLRNAMGLRALRRGELHTAEQHFRAAVERQTLKNPNPADGEPLYNLGVALKLQGKDDAAYTAFYKSIWNYAQRSAAYYALACIDSRRGDHKTALEHLSRSLLTNVEHLKARDLQASLLRRLGRTEEAAAVLAGILAEDPLNLRSLVEQSFLSGNTAGLVERFSGDLQTALDIAFDYSAEGFREDAIRLLELFASSSSSSSNPVVFYTLSHLYAESGDNGRATHFAALGKAASTLYCFPARLEEMLVLQFICEHFPDDPRAAYYLGNLFYDKRRYQEAMQLWERSVALDPSFSIPWRNLAIGEFNVRRNAEAALRCYLQAFTANPQDARLLYEWDQLKKRTGVSPEERLPQLEAHPSLRELRDDLAVEYISLLNQTGQPERALAALEGRHFSPWEGGEGLVSAQYVLAHQALGRRALRAHQPEQALEHFAAARTYPHNLGEGKHLLTLERDLDYFTGLAYLQLRDPASAREAFGFAAAPIENPLIGPGPHHYYRALALRELGREEEAQAALSSLHSYAKATAAVTPKIDYFATSLPNLLLFADDPARLNELSCTYLSALAQLGLGHVEEGRRALKRVLELEASHSAARLDLENLQASSRTSAVAPSAAAQPESVATGD